MISSDFVDEICVLGYDLSGYSHHTQAVTNDDNNSYVPSLTNHLSTCKYYRPENSLFPS